MKRPLAILALPLLVSLQSLSWGGASGRASSAPPARPVAPAAAEPAPESFLGAPLFLPIQQLWTGGGWEDHSPAKRSRAF